MHPGTQKRNGALYPHFIKWKLDTTLQDKQGFYGEGIRAKKQRLNLERQCKYGLRNKDWKTSCLHFPSLSGQIPRSLSEQLVAYEFFLPVNKELPVSDTNK